MLGIAELGLGTAILFNMYEYIAKRDIETIKSLLKFYQRCYQAIAGFVIIFGLALMPFYMFLLICLRLMKMYM